MKRQPRATMIYGSVTQNTVFVRNPIGLRKTIKCPSPEEGFQHGPII